MMGVGGYEPADEVIPGRGKTRVTRQLVDHTLPDLEIGEGLLQEGNKPVRRVQKAGDPALQVVRPEGIGVTGQGVVAAGFDEEGAGVGPAVDETSAIAGLDDVQPDEPAWPVGDKPVSQGCGLGWVKLKHWSGSYENKGL